MTTTRDLQYVLDRLEIQDLLAAYGLGHDLHQASQDNNVLAQWRDVFTPDAVIDASAVGASSSLTLVEYAELLRGPGLDGSAGMPAHFDRWQHREGWGTVTIDGDTATAISPFLHLHQLTDGSSNLIHAGLWHDQLRRLPQGWRITHRRLQDLYFNNLPRVENPQVI